MSAITNPSLKNQVRQHFARQGEDAPTWTELHGMLCALAVAPGTATPDFQQALDQPLPADIEQALASLRERLFTQLLAGEAINLPCLLDPYQEDDGQDLASWCAGFVSGALLDEPHWYHADEETMAQWLLPFFLISGLDDDEELDLLWEDSRLVREMALSLPELLEELFLYFHGPDSGTE